MEDEKKDDSRDSGEIRNDQKEGAEEKRTQHEGEEEIEDDDVEPFTRTTEGYRDRDDYYEYASADYAADDGREEERDERTEEEFSGEVELAMPEEQEEEIRERDEDEEHEEEEKAEEVRDWEREAKKKVQIELVEESTERRRTIYELTSYASMGPSMLELLDLGRRDTKGREPSKSLEPRYSVTLGAPGLARVNIQPLTQKIVGCVIGEDVTTEYPWIYVKKEVIEDNLDLHSESSDFLAVKDEIAEYPEETILIGYAPSFTEEGQFYVCLSVEGKEFVQEMIRKQREEHENRVRSAVYRTTGVWKDTGSGGEVDEQSIRNRRALFEIEVTSTADLLNAPMNLADRNANDQRDGYVELLPYRQTFDNVSRRLINRETQVTPYCIESVAQTAPSIPLNSWSQYGYEYEWLDIHKFTEEDKELMLMFLRRYTDTMCDQAQMNATWDIYMDDYGNLVRNERDTKAPIPIRYKEHQSYHDSTLIKDKVISDLSWHPLWTGIPCASYARFAKGHRLLGRKQFNEVLDASESENFVLVWSFNDCLTPKLILQCSREVTAVSVCPFDGNVIIGGCANGQVAVWSITGRIEKTEAIMVHTAAQLKHKVMLKNLTKWMRDTVDTSIVRPAAMSSMTYSQKGAITQIAWLPAYYRVNKSGKIHSTRDKTGHGEFSWQFVTGSVDGTVVFWDLKEPPPVPKEDAYTVRKKKKVEEPECLWEFDSHFKQYDRLFRPHYILAQSYPGDNRPAMVTTLSLYAPKLKKEAIELPIIKTDISIRRYYKLVPEQSDYVMTAEMLIGTIDGYVGVVTWQGLDYSTDLIINKEDCKWKWMKHIHDGPVTHIVRCKYAKEIVATVGGRVFAVWREDFGEPVLWKRSKIGYTACSWGTFRPTILILSRVDGSVEIWDLIVKSHEPTLTQSISGQIITGIYTHELPLDPQCVGFCDFNGTLRMFTAPPVLLQFDANDIEWLRKFVEHQVARIREFNEWQRTWNEKNVHIIRRKKKMAEKEAQKKREKEEAKRQAELAEQSRLEEEEAAKSKKVRKPWQFIEDAKEAWHAAQLKHMQVTILEKKGLRREVLEKQRAPVLKLQQDAERKKKKIDEILQQRDKTFDENVTFFLPEHRWGRAHERKSEELQKKAVKAEGVVEEEETREEEEAIDEEAPPPTSATLPQEKELRKSVESAADEFELPKKEIVRTDEDIMEDFLLIQQEALETLEKQEFEYTFDWRLVLKEGRARRHSMDLALKILNVSENRSLVST